MNWSWKPITDDSNFTYYVQVCDHGCMIDWNLSVFFCDHYLWDYASNEEDDSIEIGELIETL